MAWLGKVSLGNFPDLAGAVNKLSESVKNIEKNFDTALGFEDDKSQSHSTPISPDDNHASASGLWADRKAIFDTFMGGNTSDETAVQSSSSAQPHEIDSTTPDDGNQAVSQEISTVVAQLRPNQETGEVEVQLRPVEVDPKDPNVEVVERKNSDQPLLTTEALLVRPDVESQSDDSSPSPDAVERVQDDVLPEPDKTPPASLSHEDQDRQRDQAAEVEDGASVQVEIRDDENVGVGTETSHLNSTDIIHDENTGVGTETSYLVSTNIISDESPREVPNIEFTASLSSADSASLDNDSLHSAADTSLLARESSTCTSDQDAKSTTTTSNSLDYAVENEKVKKEMKLMEAALQGAARQAQAKADEIAKLMNENEQLKGVIEDLKRKSNEAEVEVLREEYHQRVSTLERKVYALTKERDTLRREQNKKSDAAALLKEKDEIINQVMAEGEELSKKQAFQESQIRKLRAQIREFEEEKKGLTTKLQAEENKVESIKRDKAATEKFLQETIEKHQAELTAQKEHYTDALNAAKEAEALAEARANNEARTELESRLREAGEREATLVQTLEELRQTLTRTEQQAVFREDMLRRDIDDLQKRYQASERRCEELITQVPESTRPLLRQIEAMQETTARRAEAWAGVERALNSRLQEAEAKAATAEENERVMNERLSQTLSRVAVLEAQVSCLRAEQTQLTRSLEKERQRASENRQEYLAAQEAVATHEVRVEQLEGEIKELRRKHKQELQELMTHNELLQQEAEREKKNRLDLERTVNVETLSRVDASPKAVRPSVENGNIPMRKLSSSGSISSMEESYFLQASLDSSDSLSDRRYPGETTMTPYFLKSMTPNAFEATLRQKDGELASYMSRLASLESIRDSLAEELVKMTAQCEKLRAEAAVVPGMRGELEALRRRHSAALELMGERDEELEELRNDIVDLKEMYREQVNLLVNKIQIMSSSVAA